MNNPIFQCFLSPLCGVTLSDTCPFALGHRPACRISLSRCISAVSDLFSPRTSIPSLVSQLFPACDRLLGFSLLRRRRSRSFRRALSQQRILSLPPPLRVSFWCIP